MHLSCFSVFMDEHNTCSLQAQDETEEELPAESSRCSKINTELVPYKSFYFLFFSAVGSLFPYLAIFYKQLGLSARQTGVLIGVRPVLQLASSLSWGIIADKSNKSRYIFLTSIAGWLCANFSLSLVKHVADNGLCRDNGSLTAFDNAIRTDIANVGPFLRNQTFDAEKALEIIDRHRIQISRNINGQLNRSREYRRTWNHVVSKLKSNFDNGMTERKLDEQSSMHAMSKDSAVSPNDDGLFAILLVITTVGTIVAAPAIPFADTATLQVLGNDKDFYGKQRQWGAIGWGLSSFLVGSVVSTIKEKPRCNTAKNVNYQPCFYAFAVLMTIAFIPAMFIHFQERNLPSENFAGRLRSWINFDHVVFLLTIQQFGNSWGLVQTFLLWHLQDLGGTQFQFSIIAAVHCLSEVLSYQIAGYAIQKFGYYRVIYLGLLFSSFRFIFYGLIKNPWYVIPIEVFHGVSTTLTWALAVSFIGLNTGVSTTMQGILSGVHWGLGLGGGAILGGVLVNAVGSKYTFIGYGIFSFINFLGFILTRYLRSCAESSEENESLLSSHAREEIELNSIETAITID